MASLEKLQKFEDAMQRVYAYESQDPAKWRPPPNSGGYQGRYLWADAFGVVNFLTLYREKKDHAYLLYAESLISTVHNVLGRTRDGIARLPRATDENPLGGGLRIGKEEETGPDGDGQYHHYLTIWMFALNRMSKATRDQNYNNQAIALAQAIHARFLVDRDSPQLHMVWKMCVDLNHPLVKSEGSLDPINGYVVFRLLQATAETKTHEKAVLDEEISDYERIMERKGRQHVSGDPLDLGMSLFIVQWVPEDDWAEDLKHDCTAMLRMPIENYPCSDMLICAIRRTL